MMSESRYGDLNFFKSEIYRIIPPLSHHIFEKFFQYLILLIISFNLMPHLLCQFAHVSDYSNIQKLISSLSHHIFEKFFLHSIQLLITFNLIHNLAWYAFRQMPIQFGLIPKLRSYYCCEVKQSFKDKFIFIYHLKDLIKRNI